MARASGRRYSTSRAPWNSASTWEQPAWTSTGHALSALGGPDAFAAAVDDSLQQATAALTDDGALRRLLFGTAP